MCIRHLPHRPAVIPAHDWRTAPIRIAPLGDQRNANSTLAASICVHQPQLLARSLLAGTAALSILIPACVRTKAFRPQAQSPCRWSATSVATHLIGAKVVNRFIGTADTATRWASQSL